MTGFSNPIIGGGGSLVYPSIHSPGFTVGPPLTGWSIDKNGNAFFANVTISGSFDGTDWLLNASGAFWYNGTPAAGNSPIAYVVPTGVTVDPFGNTLPKAGAVVSQAGLGYSALAGGAVVLVSDTATVVNAGEILVATNQLEIASENDNASFTQATLTLKSAAAPLVVVGAGAQLETDKLSSTSGSGIAVADFLDMQNGKTITADTWHNLSLATGFAAGTVTPQYRLEPMGSAGVVRLRGNMTLTANQPANMEFATLPAGYQPGKNQFLAVGNNLSGVTAGAADVSISTGGAMFITQAGSTGNEVIFDNITFPLD